MVRFRGSNGERSPEGSRGATALTYGLVVGLVALGALSAVTRIGDSTTILFGAVSSTMTDVVTTPATPSPSSTDETPLYSFSSHTFTPCGTSPSRTGPSQSQCRSSYSTSWDENDSFFTVPEAGYQLWTVPSTGTYRIEVAGAPSTNTVGHSNKSGARLQADVELAQGDQLLIVVGAEGRDGGGGGTFVTEGSSRTSASALIVAGGGASTWYENASVNLEGTTLEDWCSVDCTTPGSFSDGNNTGGNGGGGRHGGGGGGFLTAGTMNCTYGNADTDPNCQSEGQGFRQGAAGGYQSSRYGGFGGGGSFHGGNNGDGGGGGYNGGRGGYTTQDPPYGGTSYTAGSMTNRQDLSKNAGAGFATITLLP